MQYLRRLRRKKGFTITELIVVVALVGIMMATLTAFSGPVRDMVGKTRAKNEVLQINNIIGNYLEHNLSYASEAIVCAGWDLTTHSSALADLKKDLSDTWNTSMDDPRVMIIHYEDNVDTKFGNGFRIYEYKASETLPTTTGSGLDVDHLVFNRDFYADYSFLITADSIKIINDFYKKAYLKFSVKAYEFDGSIMKTATKEAYMEAGEAKSHYQNIRGETAPGSTTPIADLTAENCYTSSHIGTENVFFPLQNYYTVESKPEYFDVIYGYSSDPATTPYTYGDDIIIFYNIRTYDYTKSS
ncbi:MAG: type II secretion system GspH family protein [Ruminiclostridium sp.]|nr:type II secretion system GspH family protein [Ruminiclostridium sp.]